MVFHFRLLRRSVYDQVGGFDPKFVCAQDYDVCLKLSEVTEIMHLEKPLYYYRVHPEGISGRQRIEQIYWSHQAVQDALKRQGLTETYDLRVHIDAQFSLVPVSGR
jgi:GT2 family glycosyltransferase